MPHIDPALVFSIATYGVMPFWLLLAVAPGWKGTQIAVHSVFAPVVLGLTYLWLFAGGAFFGADVPEGGNFQSLQGVMTLFTVPEAVLAGWVHYLVFDLFVGAWQARDAKRRGVNHLLLIPCLFFTLMLGPIGLLLYLILRAATGKGGWSLQEN